VDDFEGLQAELVEWRLEKKTKSNPLMEVVQVPRFGTTASWKGVSSFCWINELCHVASDRSKNERIKCVLQLTIDESATYFV
jgi:hypothetical protein